MERQMIKSLEDSRPDHLMRYQLAVTCLQKNGLTSHVIDGGCGVGYGSFLMSQFIEQITSVELSEEAYGVYQQNFARPNIQFLNINLFDLPLDVKADGVVCFEFIEHVHEAAEAMKLFGERADFVIASTPNEEIRPHAQPPVNPYHVRHYTPDEFESLFTDAGYTVVEKFNQAAGSAPEIRLGTQGKFIIYVGVKGELKDRYQPLAP